MNEESVVKFLDNNDFTTVITGTASDAVFYDEFVKNSFFKFQNDDILAFIPMSLDNRLYFPFTRQSYESDSESNPLFGVYKTPNPIQNISGFEYGLNVERHDTKTFPQIIKFAQSEGIQKIGLYVPNKPQRNYINIASIVDE